MTTASSDDTTHHRIEPLADPVSGQAFDLAEQRQHLLSELGAQVRRLRTDLKLSQRTLALVAGLSQRFVAQLEAGQGNISVARLADVARGLGVTPSALLGSADSPPQAPPKAKAPATPERRQARALLDGCDNGTLRAVLALLKQERGHAAGDGAAHAAHLRPVVTLLGLRGAGKSTIGPLLAGHLGCPFVELDEAIREAGGLAVSEIFELHGEHYYRRAEREALRAVAGAGRPAVVAVSGGAVTDAELFRLLREETRSVWLRAGAEEHMSRVEEQGDRRPMANRPNAMQELRALLAARTPYYRQAHLTIDTSSAPPHATARRLAQLLGAG